MKKVLLFGAFDGLHKGHFHLFNQAKNYGDYVIVILARDKNIRKIKKRLPYRNEMERLKNLKKCKLVNEARLGYEDNPYRIITEIKPDVICLGYDQKSFTDNLSKELKKMGLKTKVYRMKPYKSEKFHSFLINSKK